MSDDAMVFSGREFKDQPMDALLKRLGLEPSYGSLTWKHNFTPKERS
jgi:hypothetical protein